MVNLKFHLYYFALKITSLLSPNFPFPFNVLSIFFVHPFHLISFAVKSCIFMGYYASSYIFCVKLFSAFSHISFSSMLVISHCEVFYSNILSIRIINLNFTFIFSGVPLKENVLELFRQVCQTQPLTLRRP